MSPPKQVNPAGPRDLVAELLALRPYVTHILCDGSREPLVRAAAKDRVQTVLRKAIQHLPSYQPHKEGLRPWVTRIARNEKVDAFRSSQRQDDIFGQDHIAADFAPCACPSPEHEVQVRELLEKALVIIEEMPQDVQDVLVLSAFCDDSHAEIASQLGITENAAKMRLSRARQMLRKRAGSIRDHLGVWLLFIARKIAALRPPTLRFWWQASHLLPPLLILFVALPQFEPTLTASTETVVVALPEDRSFPYVPDNHQNIDIDLTRRFVPERSVDAITSPPSEVRHASDKPRQRSRLRPDFRVDLAPAARFMNDRR